MAGSQQEVQTEIRRLKSFLQQTFQIILDFDNNQNLSEEAENSPRVTKKQKRLSTMVSMMASMSVSWMSALLMAAGETHTHTGETHTHTGETHLLQQIKAADRRQRS